MYYKNKKVIITGAASGIGKTISELLLKAGSKVALFDVDYKKLDITVKELTDINPDNIYSFSADVRNYEEFKNTVCYAVEKMNGIDIFINNAGVGIVGPFENNTEDEINIITEVNYRGMVYGSHIILDHFDKQGYGHIVNVASGAGLAGFPNMTLYCGAKAGVVMFSEALRFELKRKGIDISIALPSTTDTPMVMERLDMEDEALPGILMAIPMCKTEDVAQKILSGVRKKKFMIFPSIPDKMAYYTKRFFPWLSAFGIALVGFRAFRWKRNRLIKKYDF